MQMDWWDYDGVGRYRSRKHGYPQNRMLRDVQNRRVLEKYNQERTLVNAVWKVWQRSSIFTLIILTAA